MRNFLITIAAVAAAIALPAAASASATSLPVHGHVLFAKLAGTNATTFAATSSTVSGSVVAGDPLERGTFSASLSTNWAAATTKTTDRGTLSCAPATLTLTLTAATSAANTETSTLAGRTCTFTRRDGTVFRGFFGRGTATGAGTLSGLTGMERAFLTQRNDGSVRGMVFAGFSPALGREFAFRQGLAEHLIGDFH
jgi:hypothetical protein